MFRISEISWESLPLAQTHAHTHTVSRLFAVDVEKALGIDGLSWVERRGLNNIMAPGKLLWILLNFLVGDFMAIGFSAEKGPSQEVCN